MSARDGLLGITDADNEVAEALAHRVDHRARAMEWLQTAERHTRAASAATDDLDTTGHVARRDIAAARAALGRADAHLNQHQQDGGQR